MPDLPLVSVIMPAYNAAPYIAQAIDSVLEQDYPRIELIVVDDGSCDGTAREVRRFGKRVGLLEQQNSGPAAARNRAVSVARGELLAFLDADDVWLPGKISAQVQYLRDHPSDSVVFGRWLLWSAQADGSFGPPPDSPGESAASLIVPEESGWIYPEMLLNSVIWIVSAMVRKSLWDALGGMDESLRTGEDYDFFIRASRLTRIDKLDKAVAFYRLHQQSTTCVLRSENNECVVLLRSLERFGNIGPDGRGLPARLLRARLLALFFGHGYRHCWNGSPYIAARSFYQALTVGRWRSIKAFAYLALALVKCVIHSAGSRAL